MITTSMSPTTSTTRAHPASTRSRSVASYLSILLILASHLSVLLKIYLSIVQVPVTRKPVTVHVPQNVPVNFVPVHVPTQDLGPLSVVELDPFGNKTYLDLV